MAAYVPSPPICDKIISMIRLDRFLCEMNEGTRSEVKKLISKGLVEVNGEAVSDPGKKVDPDKDCIFVGGRHIAYAEFEYFMLNKPAGVISASRADLRSRAEICVVDLISDKKRKDLFPVGRLDKDTEGLLLITNDGRLAHDLLSPKKHVDKQYLAELDIPLTEEGRKRIEEGVDIGDDKPTLPCRISFNSENSILITIHEGRFHQIKRMLLTEGCTVTYLKRLSMGSLRLDPELKKGESRRLTGEELSMLRSGK